MREKYIDELSGGPWFEFGTRSNGNVDVAQANGDVFTDVTPEIAKQLIESRDKFLKELYEILKNC